MGRVGASGGLVSLGASVPLSIAATVAVFAAAGGLMAGARNARAWGPRGRAVGDGFLGVLAALLVLLLQSVSVGASLGGAVLAVAVGGMTLLVLMLVRST
jgi:hypothetical protein